MTEPTFEARPDDMGWCVHAKWPSGKIDVIPGFMHQYEALEWIKLHSANWVAERIMRDTNI